MATIIETDVPLTPLIEWPEHIVKQKGRAARPDRCDDRQWILVRRAQEWV